jgi:hypothetical protein
MAIISRAFLSLKSPPLTIEELDSAAELLFSITEEEAQERFRIKGLEIYVEAEEGSLTTRTKVTATLMALYIGIGQFGDFVGAVNSIAKISRDVAGAINARFINETNHSPSDVRRSRRDSGLPGEIKRLFDRVEAGDLTPEEATAQTLELLANTREPVPESLRQIVMRDVPQRLIPADVTAIRRAPRQPVKIASEPPVLQSHVIYPVEPPSPQVELLADFREHPLPERRRHRIEISRRPGEEKHKIII